MDPGGPAGRPAGPLRTARRPGFLIDQFSRAAGRAGFAAALLGFAGGLILSAVTAAVAAGLAGYRLGSSAPVPVAVTAANLIGLWVGLVAAAVWWSRAHGTGRLGPDLGLRVGSWLDIPGGIALGLACQFGLIPLLYLPFEHIDRRLSHELSKPAQQEAGGAHTYLAATVVLLFIAIGAPLVEELFFRGLLLRSLSAWAGPVVGIVASGVLFGLAHFEALQFAGLAVFGMVLAAVAWRLGRLAPTIAAHLSFNAAAVLTTVHVH